MTLAYADITENVTLNGQNMTALLLNCTGLKPNTKHEFVVDGVNQSNNCGMIVKSSSSSNIFGSTNILGSIVGGLFSGVGDSFGLSGWAAQVRTAVFGNLVTAPDGKISFVYVLPREGYSSWMEQAAQAQRSEGGTGTSIFELKAPTSVAKIMVPARPNLALPA